MAKLIKKVKVGKNQPINISAPNNNALKAKADRIYQPVVGNMVVQDKFGNVVDAGFSATQLQETLEDLSDKDTDLQDQIDELESNLATTDAKASSAYHFKGTKASVSALPSNGNTVGDVWNVGSDLDGGNYAWTGSAWDKLGDTVDLTPYETTAHASSTYETKSHAASTYATKSELENIDVSGTDPNAFNGVSASKTGSTTTLTFTKGDNTTSSVSFTDSNTVYDDSNVVHATGTGASDHIVLDGTTLQINPTTHKVYASISAQLTFEQVADFFQSGGGLVVDPTNNKVYFDADSLDNVKLQKLLRTIEVPSALSANKHLYVNGNISSDPANSDLTAGNSDNPFKSLQTCVNYVTKYYNIGDNTVYIHCKNIVQTTSLKLPDFSKGTGHIEILNDYTRESGDTNDKITINYSPTNSSAQSVNVVGGTWYLNGFNIIINNASMTGGSGHSAALCARGTSDIRLYNSDITFNDNHPEDNNPVSFAGLHNIFLVGSSTVRLYYGNTITCNDSKGNVKFLITEDSFTINSTTYSLEKSNDVYTTVKNGNTTVTTITDNEFTITNIGTFIIYNGYVYKVVGTLSDNTYTINGTNYTASMSGVTVNGNILYINIKDNSDTPNVLEDANNGYYNIVNNYIVPKKYRVRGLSATETSTLRYDSDTYNESTLMCTFIGTFYTFAAIAASFLRNGVTMPKFDTTNATASKKYYVYNGGTFVSSGGGSNYLGTENNADVESSTYSWYK